MATPMFAETSRAVKQRHGSNTKVEGLFRTPQAQKPKDKSGIKCFIRTRYTKMTNEGYFPLGYDADTTKLRKISTRPHCRTSQNTGCFTVTTVRTPNLATPLRLVQIQQTKVVPANATKAHAINEVQLQYFLTSALDGGKW